MNRIKVTLIVLLSTVLLPAGAPAQNHSTFTLREKVGQLLIFPTAAIPEAGGIILFSKSFEGLKSIDDVRTMVDGLQKGRKIPLFASIDQEGGVVQRLYEQHGFTKIPHAFFAGETNSFHLVQQLYSILASELRAAGINLNFAPTVDIHNSNSPIIGHYKRAFSASHKQVAHMAHAAVEAHLKHKIIPTLKHFPGHGHAWADSHLGHTPLERTEPELFRDDLHPFHYIYRESSGPFAIMTSHLTLPQIPMAGSAPTSLNPYIIKNWLRKRMGFNGLIISDSMDMKAIADEHSPEEAAILGILAGNDSIIMGHMSLEEQSELITNITKEALSNPQLKQRIENSFRRVIEYKNYFAIAKTNTSVSSSMPPSTMNTEEKVQTVKHVLSQSSCPLTYEQLSLDRVKIGE